MKKNQIFRSFILLSGIISIVSCNSSAPANSNNNDSLAMQSAPEAIMVGNESKVSTWSFIYQNPSTVNGEDHVWKSSLAISNNDGAVVHFNDVFPSDATFYQRRVVNPSATPVDNFYNIHFKDFTIATTCGMPSEDLNSIDLQDGDNINTLGYVTLKPGKMPPPLKPKGTLTEYTTQVTLAALYNLNSMDINNSSNDLQLDYTLRNGALLESAEVVTVEIDSVEMYVVKIIKSSDAAQNTHNDFHVTIPNFDKSKYVITMFWDASFAPLDLNAYCYQKQAAFKLN